MRYRFLLFDMDDTLFDFQETQRASFAEVMKQHGISFTQEMYDAYKKVNHGLWQDYEAGKIPKETIFTSRFAKTMEQFAVEADGLQMEQHYREYLGNGTQLIPDAREVLDSLLQEHELYIVTNGVAKTQEKRLKDSDMRHYFKDVFISETIGAAKPAPEFFAHVEAHIPEFDPAKALVIGDTLGSDIKGGRMAGIDTCWFQPSVSAAESEEYTYKISTLKELLKICT